MKHGQRQTQHGRHGALRLVELEKSSFASEASSLSRKAEKDLAIHPVAEALNRLVD